MKKIVFGWVLVALVCSAYNAQSAENKEKDSKTAAIVKKCGQALYGTENPQGPKSLRVGAIYPDHGRDTLRLEILRPCWSRNPRIDLVYDGKRACFRKGVKGQSTPVMIPEEELDDFEVEIGYFIPAFFDYTTSFTGTETVDGKKALKLSVGMAHGAKLVYYINEETYLPMKVVAEISLNNAPHVEQRVFSDYRNVHGKLFPFDFTYKGRDGSILHAKVMTIEWNVEFPLDNFTVPDIRK